MQSQAYILTLVKNNKDKNKDLKFEINDNVGI